MNWIVPGQILALSSPTRKKNDGLPPEAFIENFKMMKITAVVRLNEPLYEEESFEREGIEVFDLEFEDGTNPSDVMRNCNYKRFRSSYRSSLTYASNSSRKAALWLCIAEQGSEELGP